MDAANFIKDLRASGFILEAIGERLTIYPASQLRDDQRAFVRQHKPELLRALIRQLEPRTHPVSPEPKPETTPPSADLDSLAASMATEFHVIATAVLGLLDADDRLDISYGNQAMIKAWGTAVRSMATQPQPIKFPVGTDYPMAVVVHTPAGQPVLVWADSSEHVERLQAWNPAPKNTQQQSPTPTSVRCCDCAYAHPVSPGMIDCAREVPAPGACGPYRWWATDTHTCKVFVANTSNVYGP